MFDTYRQWADNCSCRGCGAKAKDRPRDARGCRIDEPWVTEDLCRPCWLKGNNMGMQSCACIPPDKSGDWVDPKKWYRECAHHKAQRERILEMEQGIAAERERCARICENAHMSTHDTAMSPQRQCAYAIRNSATE